MPPTLTMTLLSLLGLETIRQWRRSRARRRRALLVIALVAVTIGIPPSPPSRPERPPAVPPPQVAHETPDAGVDAAAPCFPTAPPVERGGTLLAPLDEATALRAWQARHPQEGG